MSKLENKIDARDRSISDVLEKNKYTVDYYQREYSWQQKHIEQLVTDLATAFLNEYQTQHYRWAAALNVAYAYFSVLEQSSKNPWSR